MQDAVVTRRRLDREANRLEAADEFANVLPHLGPGNPRDDDQLANFGYDGMGSWSPEVEWLTPDAPALETCTTSVGDDSLTRFYPVVPGAPEEADMHSDPKQLLVAVDGSPAATAAVDVAVELAAAMGATLLFVHATSKVAEALYRAFRTSVRHLRT